MRGSGRVVYLPFRIAWQKGRRGPGWPGVGDGPMETRGPDLLKLSERPTPARPRAGTAAVTAQAEPVLFWAERDLATAFRGWAFVTALILPAGLLFPEAVLVAAAVGALLTWLNQKAFRLELTRHELRLRPGLFAATRRWPLAELGLVEARDAEMRRVRWGAPRPTVGHVLIEVPDGLLGIPGIVEPLELVEAIETLRNGGTGPPVGHERR